MTQGQLAVRLLERERECIPNTSGLSLEFAERRLIRMMLELEDEPLAVAKIESLTKGILGVPLSSIRSAVRTAKADRAKKKLGLSKDSIRNAECVSEVELCFDGLHYFRRGSDNTFQMIGRADALLDIRIEGLSDRTYEGETCSEAERVLNKIQKDRYVDYAAPFCGRMAGLYKENGFKILATNSPNLPQPMKGDASPLASYFGGLFGHGVDSLWETQYNVFLGWMKWGLEAFRNPDQHLNGQMLVIVGPKDCGKTLCQTLITRIFGGRGTDPSLWLMNRTDFNDSLWGAEHLILSDSNLPEGKRGLNLLRDGAKKIVANELYPCHRKNRPELSLRPIWRLSLTANPDDGPADILPGLDESFEDKVIYLQGYPPPIPFPTAGSIEAKGRFFQGLVDAIPAFVAALDEFTIPQDLQSGRFGVQAFHHPQIVDLIQSMNPEADLADFIDGWIRKNGYVEREISAADLHDQLNQQFGDRFLRTSTKPTHLGNQLARLRKVFGWEDRIEQVKTRVGSSNSQRNLWRIRASGVAGAPQCGLKMAEKDNNDE